MILIKTDYPDFETYLASLSKPARKNYKHAMKLYAGCFYVEETEFDVQEVHEFMQLWQRQLVRGKHPEWAFPVEHVRDIWDKGELKLFSMRNKHNEKWAMHFIQKRDGYWECHPPMYDKKHSEMGTLMWFALIHYAILRRFAIPLDMGGGSDDWRYTLRNRASYPNPRYKFRFVPERAKEDPDSEPAYYIGRPANKLMLRI